MCGNIWILIFLFSTPFSWATLSKSDRSKPKKESRKPNSKIEEKDANDVIFYYEAFKSRESQTRAFRNPVLGYVTPWHNKGYDVAKTYGAKFTHISPVWLQLKKRDSFYIDGGHDIDRKWVNDVRQKGPAIVPRLLFDGISEADMKTLLAKENLMIEVSNTIVNYFKRNLFDGVVLELWMQYAQTLPSQDIIYLITLIGEALRKAEILVILAIPPPLHGKNFDSQGMFGKSDFDQLEASVDFFSLMTYDFSSSLGFAGPNSPIGWLKPCVESLVPSRSSPKRKKILLGLNFYGMHYASGQNGPIIGSQYIDLLKAQKTTFQWNDNFAEHSVSFTAKNNQHAVFYPTLKSIAARIKLAEELGCGLSIWEIGQGLDYFYELL